MAYESAIVKHWTDGSLVLSDGTGSPVTLTVDLEVGDMSITGLGESHKDVRPYYSRGSLVSLRKGQDAHPSISFSTLMGGLSDAALETVSDFPHGDVGGGFQCLPAELRRRILWRK